MRAPYGAACAGYKLFVNLVEPDIGRFCIRCCKENDRKLCNSYKSEYGCKRVIKGNYGPQSNREEVPEEEYLPATLTPPATVSAQPTPPGRLRRPARVFRIH
ncbi:MAG: hypothetical protein BJ554DRAFT_7564 [Olpidium bornovanus]|uniref:Uncharacterized protein n=1 Tax=Olpidium bornovanus TaxID=278681 RepID=A0A8H7ZVX4_9FUNG|nr:MAG: hypothetical protein BJ554DRAFT_7564 [Olpidium bornovanus]